MLELHLSYLGSKISCNIVKPFLPLLLEHHKIGIPTPITVHLDRCESCQNDLAIIKSLGLIDKQLKALHLMFSSKSGTECVNWSDASESIQSYVDFNFQAIEPNVLKHLCYCGVCQLMIYKLRAKRLEDLQQKQISTLPCKSTSFCDVFDYCFPYEMADHGDGDQYAKFREPFIAHLRQCPECLGRIQQLQEEIYAIRRRPESGVVTIYDLGRAKESVSTSESENIYDGFPIKVKALTPVRKTALGKSSKGEHVGGCNIKLFRKGLNYLVKGTIAAAVILVIALFLRSTPTATAATLEQIYEAIQKASNVYIQKFVAGSSNPIQEKWISKSAGIYAVKDKNGFSSWDLQKGVRTTKKPSGAESEEVQLTEAEIVTIRQRKFGGSLGLLPFECISQLPKGARWSKADDRDSSLAEVDSEVYELSWSVETLQGEKTNFKWHVFVKSGTNKPLRTEFYERTLGSSEYELQIVQKVEYLTEEASVEHFLSIPSR
jgi:hypothetical protein